MSEAPTADHFEVGVEDRVDISKDMPQFVVGPSMVEAMRAEVIRQPENAHDLVEISPQALRNLAIQDYVEYLYLLQEIRADNFMARNLSLIADRFEEDLNTLTQESNFNRPLLGALGKRTKEVFWCIARNPEIRLNQELVERMYSFIDHENYYVRLYAVENLASLVVIDTQGRIEGDRLGLLDRFQDDVVERLISPQREYDVETAQDMLDLAWGNFGRGVLYNIFFRAMEKADNEQAIRVAFSSIANRVSFEQARHLLKEHARTKPEFEGKLEQIEKALNLDARGEKVYADLVKLYEDIVFVGHTPNVELDSFEDQFLREHLEGDGPFVDIGYGPEARHMEGLIKAGKTVYGFDIVHKHAEMAKARLEKVIPELSGQVRQDKSISPVAIASWYNMPYKSKSLKGAYCLGRGFLHCTRVEDGVDFLLEVNRVLADDAKFYVDLADPNAGHYAQERARLAKAADERGIYFREQGTIIDSPDDVVFFDRQVFIPEQFKAMALLAGFKARIVAQREFRDGEGNVNNNFYWELGKLDRKLNIYEILDAMHDAHTGGPPLRFKSF